MRKRCPIRQTLQKNGNVEISDIFIESISSNHKKSHHHFIMQKLNGEGLYLFRDENDLETRRMCTIWDLGNLFGSLVMGALQEMA